MGNTIITTPLDQYQVMLNNYASIVEKTNNQVALWSNPYSIMVMVLGILFTILTIAAAVIIWWQSREHKKMIREELNNVIDSQRKEAIEILKKEKEDEIRSAADEQKEELQSQLTILQKKEMDLKIGAPDLSQYMKKDDFLCNRCKSDQLDSYSFLTAGMLHANRWLSFGVKRKCVSCGEEL